MRCFVTGASGFIGANLLHELVARGHEVKALLRPGSERRGVTDLPCDVVSGDVADRVALRSGLRGCDWCFHLAASYHLWLPDYGPMFRTNVDGTRAVLEAARDEGCQRIVYTSTVGCMGLPPQRNGRVVPSDEATPVSEAEMITPYKRSKWEAEALALAMARQGVPVVLVHPSAPVGPRDVRPTPTGQIILDFLRGRLPAYLDTGLNFVPVQDVALGHILAAERGQVGERYILGHQQGNWTLQEVLQVLGEIAGLPVPKLEMPYAVAWMAAWTGECMARWTGRPPRVPLAGVQLARQKMYFNPSKAIRELGLPQSSLRDALAAAVAWFREHGYLSCRRNGGRPG